MDAGSKLIALPTVTVTDWAPLAASAANAAGAADVEAVLPPAHADVTMMPAKNNPVIQKPERRMVFLRDFGLACSTPYWRHHQHGMHLSTADLGGVTNLHTMRTQNVGPNR